MIKVGIVDDHAIVRSGLKQFFSEQVDLLRKELFEPRPHDGVVVHNADFDHASPSSPSCFIVPHFRLEMAYP